jgi:lipopolysaccharide/colanic/teichoic acid biosynthesis glycosyltransferase
MVTDTRMQSTNEWLSHMMIQSASDLENVSDAERCSTCSWRGELADRLLAGLALCVLSPLLALIALAVLAGTGWPVLFRQSRIGQRGKAFQLLKFRTMLNGKNGPLITARGDSRITRVGRFLRKSKLDELPQLWNVVRGEMSLVGPRPEVPQFVDMNSPVWRSVLRVRPGITDPASIAFRNEEEILAKAAHPIAFYEENVLPAKLALNLAYLEKKCFWLDVKVILETARCAMFPRKPDIKESGV